MWLGVETAVWGIIQGGEGGAGGGAGGGGNTEAQRHREQTEGKGREGQGREGWEFGVGAVKGRSGISGMFLEVAISEVW